MAQINLHRQSTILEPDNQSYRMKLSVTSTDGISNYVFVNQRIKNYRTGKTDDIFCAIPTPEQLESYGKDAPLEGSSYFLSTFADVISRNADYLEEVFNDIVSQLVKLTGDIEALNVLNEDGTYHITSSNVTIS